ncbi:MAG TPA: hypothetical protein VET25_12295 [Aestuariivirgaceae bacterium]|nr:hypothetical protein [Aestuariivirgaceae bacterium]
MIEDDQVIFFRKVNYRREFEAVQGAAKPMDVNLRVLRSEEAKRAQQRIDRAPMLPGDSTQPNLGHRTLHFS